jgi:FkbM family methyltransferase
MGLLDTLRWIVNHPLNERDRLRAIARFLRWQLGSRILPGPVAVPFVDDARLLVEPGMTGATGNVYAGLHEFADMAFVLHLLRPGDLFVDAGANIGSYTVLASAGAGARSISVEPLPHTYQRLLDNVHLNRLEDLVTPHNVGLGAQEGELAFTSDLDSTNHVLMPGEPYTSSLTVPVATLDGLTSGKEPTCLKIDVEGYEEQVLAGGKGTLASPSLLAVVLELGDLARGYGSDPLQTHQSMLDQGFSPHGYAPFTRGLTAQPGLASTGNTLYIRDADAVRQRLREAPSHSVLGQTL